MDMLSIVLGLGVLGLGGLSAWLLAGRGRLISRAASAQAEARAVRGQGEIRFKDLQEQRDRARAQAEESGARVIQLSRDLARVVQELADVEQVRQQMERNEERMREAFKALSGEALKASGESLLNLAEQRLKRQQEESTAELEKRRQAVEALVKPIGETLAATREKLGQIEQSRAEAFARLAQQITDVNAASAQLRGETGKLVRALSKPEIRGRYGEIQLRRVAELAGMVAYCDFDEQVSARDDDGRVMRPDLIVRLPNERVIAVDAKTNTYAYVEAVSAENEEERQHHLDRFAEHVAGQVTKLGRKGYWSGFEGSAEFVVMFVPGDQFLDAALARKPDLLERAAERGVILASPATLIGLLRAVAVGWREHQLTEQAKELFELGRELHQRVGVVLEHADSLGRAIGQAAERYNRFVGSVDARLLPTLRRFEESGVKSGKALVEPVEMTEAPRRLLEGAE